MYLFGHNTSETGFIELYQNLKILRYYVFYKYLIYYHYYFNNLSLVLNLQKPVCLLKYPPLDILLRNHLVFLILATSGPCHYDNTLNIH